MNDDEAVEITVESMDEKVVEQVMKVSNFMVYTDHVIKLVNEIFVENAEVMFVLVLLFIVALNA